MSTTVLLHCYLLMQTSKFPRGCSCLGSPNWNGSLMLLIAATILNSRNVVTMHRAIMVHLKSISFQATSLFHTSDLSPHDFWFPAWFS